MRYVFVFLLFLVSLSILWGATLTPYVSVGGDVTISSETYSQIASLTLSSHQSQDILVLSTWTNHATTGASESGSDSPVVRINSDETRIQRDLPTTGDKGIGSCCGIFTAPGSGDATYTLEAAILSRDDLTMDVRGTLVAIPLTDSDSQELPHDQISVSGTTTSGTFSEVTATIAEITLPHAGDIYVTASVQTGAASISGGITGEWRLAYKKGDGSWSALGTAVNRSMDKDWDEGALTLVAVLENTTADDFDFRLEHRVSDGTGTIETNHSNLCVVGLTNTLNRYEAYVESASSVTTGSSTYSTALSHSASNDVTAKYLLHSKFECEHSSAGATGSFHLNCATGPITNKELERYFRSSSTSGSGAQVGIADITATGSYSLDLEFKTTAATLTLPSVYLTGFCFTSDNDAPLPVTLSHFSAAFIGTTPVIAWTTQSESGNAGWNVYRGTTQDALQNGEVTLLNSGLINGAGTTSEPTNYTFSDEYAYNTNTTYYYWLESVSVSGVTENHGSVQLYIPQSDPGSPAIPEEFGLYQNYPNPFNPTTTISFSVPSATRATVTIYNAKGGKVADVFNGIVPAKEVQSILWDGTDSFGKPVTSGIYLYKMHTEKETLTKRMMLVK